ncbi:MAG: tRNA pseudouridine(38-40) synthase TruA [Armatimonadota bacterium]
MRNVRLLVEYDGTLFHGFARQQGTRTVQGVLESCLQSLLNEPITVVGASRTDAGVHARGQVVNFFTTRPIPLPALQRTLNGRLPPDLKVRTARTVPIQFHARFSARSREYHYTLYQHEHPSVWRIRYAWHYPHPLDREHMAEALRSIEGTHDFRPFSVKTPPTQNTVRTLYRTAVVPTRNGTRIILEGTGFLRGMVRLIVGAIVLVGRRERPLSFLRELLEASPQRPFTQMAPPQGLCLHRVKYLLGTQDTRKNEIENGGETE